MRTRTVQFAFLWALLILHLGVSSGTAQTPPIRPSVSEQVSPVVEISIRAQDGYPVIGVVRMPPGQGPFPALITVRGGARTTLSELKDRALTNRMMTRFLAAGYVTVIQTARSVQNPEDPQTLLNALQDHLAIVEHAKLMAEVDPSSVVVYGCSGRGDLVLELATETEIAAVAVEEPATVGFTGMGNTPDLAAFFENPRESYTVELQRFTQEKIRKIRSPILIAQGDQLFRQGGRDLNLHRAINEILVPELRAAGKELEEIVYPGQPHCFGSGSSEAAREFFVDMDEFFKRHLNTQPVQVDWPAVEIRPRDRGL